MFNQFSKQQKHRLFAVGVATFVAVIGTAHADTVRITSINDSYDPNHAAEIFVKPGDVVTFSADLLEDANNFQAEGDTVEDFIWSANDATTDVCDAASQSDCLTNSNFQVTNYGVSFYVPYSIGQSMVIRVGSHSPLAVEGGQPSFDVVTLTNQGYQAGAVPPTTVITSPDQYDQGTFDPETALAGQGRWIVIGDTRYWSPYTYVVDNDNEWQPYQHGYWTNSNLGWTWVSYDPWGWATDHYGIWRHHESYGWMWLPFDDFHYEPHTVTWFNDNNRIGWYPYHDGWDAGYRHGAEFGFNDGYWEGHNVFRGYGDAGYGFHAGFTCVENRNFRNVDIYGSRFDDSKKMAGIFRDSYNRNTFNHELGGFGNHDDSRRFVEGRVGGAVPFEQVNRFRTPGGAELMRQNQVHAVPDSYRQIVKNDHFNGRPVPVGSVLNQRQGGNNHGGFIPPSSNGRGLVAPPRAIDPKTGQSNEMPPRTSRPLAPQPQNPIGAHQPVVKPINHPTPGSVPHPGYNPHQPAPVAHPSHGVPPVQGQPGHNPGPVNPGNNPQPGHNPGPVNPGNNPQPGHNPGPVNPGNNPQPGHNPGPVNPGNNPQPGHNPGPVNPGNNPQPGHNPGPVNPGNNPQPGHNPGPVNPGNNPQPGHNPGPVNPGNNPQPGHNPGPVNPHPAPAPAPVVPHPVPAPAPYHPAPAPAPVVPHPVPAPAPYHPAPAPAPYHPAPAPAPVVPHPAPAPAPYHPAPAPAPAPYHPAPAPAPAPYHPAPAPAPYHPAPAPAPYHPAPAPAPYHPAPSPGGGGGHSGPHH